MKVIVAGGRDITAKNAVLEAIKESGFTITELISGGASGVDAVGEWWAAEAGVPIKRFLADWSKHGKSAGPKRNAQMAAYADALVLVWDGKSRGSASMLAEAKKKGLKVFVKVIRPGSGYTTPTQR